MGADRRVSGLQASEANVFLLLNKQREAAEPRQERHLSLVTCAGELLHRDQEALPGSGLDQNLLLDLGTEGEL